jgi:hypothetical protein
MAAAKIEVATVSREDDGKEQYCWAFMLATVNECTGQHQLVDSVAQSALRCSLVVHNTGQLLALPLILAAGYRLGQEAVSRWNSLACDSDRV